jgi:Uma2 family endonuclease
MTATLEPPSQDAIAPHRFSAAEYHKMHESGVFPDGQRTQLIRGEIYFMAAMGAAHYRAIRVLNKALSKKYGDISSVVPQAPIILWDDSEPEPDFALVSLEWVNDPPFARDVLLTIEISDSTLKFDRNKKLAEYARSGIPETWILNLIDAQLEVYRQPSGEQYLQLQILKPEMPIAPLFAPDVPLEWWTALEGKVETRDPSNE